MSNQFIPDIKILHEDTSCVVVYKPAGLMVHPDGRSSGPFLTDWIMDKYPDIGDVGEPARTVDGDDLSRPGIVHRLDRETSGVLIVAKTKDAHAVLKKQFQDRTVSKKYLAFVWGEMTEDFGTITRSIGRSASNFRKWSAQRGARGELRTAETYWQKIKSQKVKIKIDEQDKDESFTLVEVEPRTGRTHQIRVHFTAINHPVVGDNLYSPNKPPALGFVRTALHAKSIEFDSPETGKRTKVEAPLPDDFSNACLLFGIQLKT